VLDLLRDATRKLLPWYLGFIDIQAPDDDTALAAINLHWLQLCGYVCVCVCVCLYSSSSGVVVLSASSAPTTHVPTRLDPFFRMNLVRAISSIRTGRNRTRPLRHNFNQSQHACVRTLQTSPSTPSPAEQRTSSREMRKFSFQFIAAVQRSASIYIAAMGFIPASAAHRKHAPLLRIFQQKIE